MAAAQPKFDARIGKAQAVAIVESGGTRLRSRPGAAHHEVLRRDAVELAECHPAAARYTFSP